MVFWEIDPQHHGFLQSVESSKEFMQKNLKATLLFVDFSKAFDSIHKGKMEQLLLTYGLLMRVEMPLNKETKPNQTKH